MYFISVKCLRCDMLLHLNPQPFPLPPRPPYRTSGQRRYSEDVVSCVLLIRFASDMGFSLAEIRVFLNGLRDKTPVGARWRKLACRKIKRGRCGNQAVKSAKISSRTPAGMPVWVTTALCSTSQTEPRLVSDFRSP